MSKILNIGKGLLKKASENTMVQHSLMHAAEATKEFALRAFDSHNERVKSLIEIPDVLDVNVHQAKTHLEKLGFNVQTILVKPNTKYRSYNADTVVRTIPRSGKVKAGTIIKVYYTDESVIQESQSVELIDVVGMQLEKAVEIFENVGLKVTTDLLLPKKEYALKSANHVIKMEPAPTMLNQHILKSRLIRLHYLDQKGLEISKAMLEESNQKIKERNEKIIETISKPKRVVMEQLRKPIKLRNNE